MAMPMAADTEQQRRRLRPQRGVGEYGKPKPPKPAPAPTFEDEPETTTQTQPGEVVRKRNFSPKNPSERRSELVRNIFKVIKAKEGLDYDVDELYETKKEELSHSTIDKMVDDTHPLSLIHI